MQTPSKGSIASIAGLAGLVLLIIGLYSSYVIVEPGTVGVVTYFGAVQDKVLPEGLHFVMPIKTHIVHVDVRIQKVEAEVTASSKDLQIVSSKVVLNFFLNKEMAQKLFQELGPAYRTNIIQPAIQESVKSQTAQFTAEALITKRQEVKESIFNDIQERLAKYDILATDFSIVDFNFSSEFNKAIEDKQVAEQRALRAKNDLIRIRTEAEQARAKAEGEAEALLAMAKAEAESQRLMRQSLNDQIVRLRTVEKWDGKLPTVVGGSGTMPMLDLKGLAGGK